MSKIVIAFDSFKGCMTAQEACHTAATAIRELMPDAEVVECPLSDGGEGLVDCVEKRLSVRRVDLKAHDPLMNIIDTSYVISDDWITAYMEMAATSGLTLVPDDKRNPMLTTTYGVGDMIIDAVKRGSKEIVMGIGGSATCDGGRGMIQCLIDNGYALPFSSTHHPTPNTQHLTPNTHIPHITVASDVTNPLYGELGASYVFAPQKGATPEQVRLLDERLREFAKETEALELATPSLALHPGAGAAGGLGYGLMAYLKAEMKSGIDIILSISAFDDAIKSASLVITGEGKSDMQTLMGKVPHGVLKHSAEHGIPVWLVSGAIDDSDNNLAKHFALVKSINEGDNRPLATLLQPSVAKENLRKMITKMIYTYRMRDSFAR